MKAQSGYVLRRYELNDGNSRDPVSGLPPNFDRGTPPTPWDITNRPEDFDSGFGIPLGRYLDDWVYDDGNTGNLDECNGATDINGVYGYYITGNLPVRSDLHVRRARAIVRQSPPVALARRDDGKTPTMTTVTR